jgi:hypothetical protein
MPSSHSDILGRTKAFSCGGGGGGRERGEKRDKRTNCVYSI